MDDHRTVGRLRPVFLVTPDLQAVEQRLAGRGLGEATERDGQRCERASFDPPDLRIAVDSSPVDSPLVDSPSLDKRAPTAA